MNKTRLVDRCNVIHTWLGLSEFYLLNLSGCAQYNRKAIEDSRLSPRVQRIVRLQRETPSCTARLMAKGCQSAGGNAERDGAEALQLRTSLSCLPLTDIRRL